MFRIVTDTSANLPTDYGPKIDANARVVNTEDRPIPGLYAAGAAAGGIWYAADVSGSQLGGCMVFGRLAARHAAARAKKA